MQVHIDLNVTTENSNLFWLPAVNNSVHLHRSLSVSPPPAPVTSNNCVLEMQIEAKEKSINSQDLRNEFHWLFIFPSFSFAVPLEACFSAKIRRWHYHTIPSFYWIFHSRWRGAKRALNDFFLSFYSAFPSFHPRWVSVEFSWHPLPSLSSRSTSENNFFNSLTNWHLCQV